MTSADSLFRAHRQRAAEDLSLQILGPFEAALSTGASVRAHLLIRSFGGVHGMLIFSDFSPVEDLVDEIVRSGYGFSVLSVPNPADEHDRASFVQMLEDWGWWGLESDRPNWFSDPE